MARLSLVMILLSGLMGCATLIGPPTMLRDLRFFEQGPRDTAPRKYQTQFDASSARYIAVEVKLEHPALDRVVELPMTCRYVDAGGREVGESSWTHRVEPAWTGSSAVGMLGWSTAGKWAPGTYQVECRTERRLIARGAFEVVQQFARQPARTPEPQPPISPPPAREPQPSTSPPPAREPQPPISPPPAREEQASSSPAPTPKPQPTTPAPAPVAPVVPPDPGPAKPEPALPPSQPRLALVIGNTQYPGSPLRNPVNDATAMADLLRELDFTVTLRTNANKSTMERSIEDFTTQVPRGSVGLFYFSGHGVAVDGINYLIPITSALREPSDVKYRAVSADWVLDRMDDAGMDMKILILDACRDNPFIRSGTRSLRRGLATMEGPKGSLIAYATSPGRTALDGSGLHSPYTKQLLRQIPEPRRPMELMFKAVRREVERETNGQQTPWESSSVTGEFYFAGR